MDGKHVMISYNQTSAGHLAKQINERLKQNDIKTWIDYEKMDADIYRAMAEGIDNAFVVLVFVTHEYCASNNCQKECSYAEQHGKPIIPIRVNSVCDPIKLTGKVGLIIGSLLYQDFSNPYNFDNSFSTLLARIRKHQGVNVSHPQSDQQQNKKQEASNYTQDQLQQQLLINQLFGVSDPSCNTQAYMEILKNMEQQKNQLTYEYLKYAANEQQKQNQLIDQYLKYAANEQQKPYEANEQQKRNQLIDQSLKYVANEQQKQNQLIDQYLKYAANEQQKPYEQGNKYFQNDCKQQ